MRKYAASLAATTCFALTLMGTASATPVLLFSNAAAEAVTTDNVVWGWEFTANQTVSVDALDTYFLSPSGSSNVRIYDTAGNVLASTTITGSDTHVGGAFSYFTHAISSVSLTAGNTYFIAEDAPSGSGAWLDASGITTVPSISYDSPVLGGSSSNPMTDPSGGAFGQAFFGPNFEIAAANVPEPATVFLVAAALGGLLFARSRVKSD